MCREAIKLGVSMDPQWCKANPFFWLVIFVFLWFFFGSALFGGPHTEILRLTPATVLTDKFWPWSGDHGGDRD